MTGILGIHMLIGYYYCVGSPSSCDRRGQYAIAGMLVTAVVKAVKELSIEALVFCHS